jgi:hypothetical protein
LVQNRYKKCHGQALGSESRTGSSEKWDPEENCLDIKHLYPGRKINYQDAYRIEPRTQYSVGNYNEYNFG